MNQNVSSPLVGVQGVFRRLPVWRVGQSGLDAKILTSASASNIHLASAWPRSRCLIMQSGIILAKIM